MIQIKLNGAGHSGRRAEAFIKNQVGMFKGAGWYTEIFGHIGGERSGVRAGRLTLISMNTLPTANLR